MSALCHDHVARYNIRRSTTAAAAEIDIHENFEVSTYGSHHLRLVDRFATLWNTALGKPKNQSDITNLCPLPTFVNVDSKEQFGLVRSNHSTTFGGLLQMPKDEPKDEEDILAVIPDGDQLEIDSLLDDLKIDPILLSQPEKPLSRASTTTSIVAPTAVRGSEPAQAPSRPPDVIVESLDPVRNSISDLLLQDLTATTINVGPSPLDSRPPQSKRKSDKALDPENQVAKRVRFEVQPEELMAGSPAAVSTYIGLDVETNC